MGCFEAASCRSARYVYRVANDSSTHVGTRFGEARQRLLNDLFFFRIPAQQENVGIRSLGIVATNTYNTLIGGNRSAESYGSLELLPRYPAVGIFDVGVSYQHVDVIVPDPVRPQRGLRIADATRNDEGVIADADKRSVDAEWLRHFRWRRKFRKFRPLECDFRLSVLLASAE